MSSLARRSLRTTAAVAGIAAASVGLAGPAFAAPAPEGSGTDDAAPATTDAAASPDAVGDLPPAPGLADLPMLFTFEGPSIYTADQGLPELPDPGEAVNVDGLGQIAESDFTYQAAAPQDRDGALPELDTAGVLGPVLGATEGNDVRA